jgi:cytochrome c oxidase subunit II
VQKKKLGRGARGRTEAGTKRMRGTKLFPVVAAALTLVASGSAHALEWYFQSAVTPIARDIDTVHEYVMWLIIVIFVVVFGAMFYACYAHRKSIGHKAAQFHENTTVELFWTVIPAIILVFIAWPVTKVVIAQKDTSAPDLTIKATGYQWKWGYDYLKGEGEGISFLSMLATPRDQIEGAATKGEHYLLEVDNEVVVPVDKKVRILTTAGDVIHSWWVPAFGAKQDAIPGFIRDTWFKAEKVGTYRGQCVELCGKEHGFMPIVVRVVSQEDYSKWVGEKKKAMLASADDPNKTWALDELKARGEKVYAANCVACHQASGKGAPPAFPPLDGSKVVGGPKEGHIDMVLNGKPNTAMAAFGKQLSDTEIAAVITYERNSWSNKAGIVQPAEVKVRHK